MNIITVVYIKNDGTFGGREYHYQVAENVEINPGDEIYVPVRDTTTKAKVRRTCVSRHEVEKFADKLKTINEIERVEKKKPDDELGFDNAEPAKDSNEEEPAIDDDPL